jgi:hypothetical protein
LSISFAALLLPDGERRPVGAAIAVTWIVMEPLQKLAIHHRLRRATVIDARSLAGRKSLNTSCSSRLVLLVRSTWALLLI